MITIFFPYPYASCHQFDEHPDIHRTIKFKKKKENKLMLIFNCVKYGWA